MIVRPKSGLRDILFAVRGSIIRRAAAPVVFITALACGAVAWTQFHRDPLSGLGTAPFTLIGISLSIFLSFRNSACYDRWWEGRKQWGNLLIEARSFAREVVCIAPEPARERLLQGICGFAHALAARLRGEDEVAAASAWMPDTVCFRGHPNVTDAILAQVGAECSALAAGAKISKWRYIVIEARLVGLSSVQAGCERIKNTPLPFAYTLLIHRTTYLFCTLLPFGLAAQLGWFTPLLVAVISYALFGLDALGDELEEPFGRDENDLPLESLVRTVEREMLAALGETRLPAPIPVVDFLLP
jgi:ion channel-forming bestrophin family protein